MSVILLKIKNQTEARGESGLKARSKTAKEGK